MNPSIDIEAPDETAAVPPDEVSVELRHAASQLSAVDASCIDFPIKLMRERPRAQ